MGNMNFKQITFLFLILSAAKVFAEYKVTKYEPITNYDSEFLELCISAKSKTDYNFKQIFDLVSIHDENLSIRILGITNEARLELFKYYKKNNPVELNEVLKNSGGIHNPKLGPLQDKFTDAFKSTTLFIELEKVLSIYQYQVMKIEFEKLFVSNNEVHVTDIYIKCFKNT